MERMFNLSKRRLKDDLITLAKYLQREKILGIKELFNPEEKNIIRSIDWKLKADNPNQI